MAGAQKTTNTWEDPLVGTVTETVTTNGQVTNTQTNFSGGILEGRSHSNRANTDGASHTVYQTSLDGDGADPLYEDFEQDFRFVSGWNENQSHRTQHTNIENAGTDYNSHSAGNNQGYNSVVMVDDAHPVHNNTRGNGFGDGFDLFA